MSNPEVFHSDQFHKAYTQAVAQCHELKLGYVFTEHVLYRCLFNNELVEKLLSEITFQKITLLRQALEKHLSEVFPLVNIIPEELHVIQRKMIPKKIGEYELELDEPSQVAHYCNLSPTLARVMEKAAWPIKENSKLISLESFILCLFSENHNVGVQLLEEAGLSRPVFEKIFHSQVKVNANEKDKEKEKSLMFKFCRNIFQDVVAKNNFYLLRSSELQKMAEIFARKEKNNLVISGPSGVGKTALVEQMISRMNEKSFSANLNKASVLQLDINALVAGTKFRGEFEERMDGLVKELLAYKKSCILVIDNLHLVVGSGNHNGMDMAHFLAPLLQAPHLRLIGTSTQEDWRQVLEEQSSFSRYFEKVELKPLSTTDTLKLISHKSKEFSLHHQVNYPSPLLEEVVTLSSKYLLKKVQPDAAIDLLDRVGAKVALAGNSKSVSTEALYQALAEVTNLPSLKIAQSEKDKVLSLQSRMHESIFGQAEAVKKLGQAIVVAKSGLREGHKPIGSFLFVGPTGVGKTELSLILAEELGMPLIRFDMSEYLESHSISKLIGAPAGYVGYGKGGLLSEKIEENPQSVILIDELEKAHPDVYNLFLQIMDNGSFRDAQGRTINCQNIILIMTSNLGAKEAQASSVGLHEGLGSTKQDKVITQSLRPEFINRLDALIKFTELSLDELAKVLLKHVDKLNTTLAPHDISVELTSDVRDYLVAKAAAEKMGARPLKRLIESEIKQELGLKILEGTRRQKVKISLENNTLKFDYATL